MSFTALGEYGEYKHSLTVSEIPNHAHNIPAFNYYAQAVEQKSATAHMETSPVDQQQPTSYEGENQAFSLLQPSIAVNIWRRTA